MNTRSKKSEPEPKVGDLVLWNYSEETSSTEGSSCGIEAIVTLLTTGGVHIEVTDKHISSRCPLVKGKQYQAERSRLLPYESEEDTYCGAKWCYDPGTIKLHKGEKHPAPLPGGFQAGKKAKKPTTEKPTAKKPTAMNTRSKAKKTPAKEEPDPRPPQVGDRVLFEGSEFKLKKLTRTSAEIKAGNTKARTVPLSEIQILPGILLAEEAIKQFGLSENDIFETPQIAHDIMTEKVGWDTSKAFDPCSLPTEACRNPDGTLINGLTIDWAPQTFCNPPFSKDHLDDWIAKGIEEVKKGKEVCFLLPAECYVKASDPRTQKWLHGSRLHGSSRSALQLSAGIRKT
eukprot:COSAG05_NODE_1143_length_5736_cov_9.876885_5_plen_343_part_00